MGLILPLGLLGLLSIIALIIIYIIKPKYQEKMVSSTVVWRLSLKYQKRKVPFQLLKRSLLFFIQLLILACFALMLARPFLNLDTYSGEKVFILDASASMLTKENGETRFDRALDDILKNVNQKEEEDKITVIFADAQASFVARRDDSSENLKKLLSNLDCTFGGANITQAITLANGVLAENPEAEVVLYTDCDYEEPGYVKVKNMGSGEWNAALLGIEKPDFVEGYYVFTVDAGNYGRAADLTFELTVTRTETDEKGNPVTVTETAQKTVSFAANEQKQVTFGVDDGVKYTKDFKYASVELLVEDGFPYDRILTVEGVQASERWRNVELVSEQPFFLYNALESNKDNKLRTATITKIGSEIKIDNYSNYGYDVYFYDEGKGGDLAKIKELDPQNTNDGAIVLFNPGAAVARAFGITLAAERQTGNYPVRGTNSISVAYQSLTKLIDLNSMRVAEYLRATSYSDDYEVILTCNGDPVLLAGERNGVTVVVMLFDIRYSTLPLQGLFTLVDNICEYAAPKTLSKSTFDAGETVNVNVKPNCQSVQVKFESLTGENPVSTEYPELPVSFKATEAGKYTVTQNLANGKVKTSEFHVKPPSTESNFSYVGGYLAPESYDGSTGSASIQHNILEFLPYIVGFCLLLLAVEWGLQYREQF